MSGSLGDFIVSWVVLSSPITHSNRVQDRTRDLTEYRIEGSVCRLNCKRCMCVPGKVKADASAERGVCFDGDLRLTQNEDLRIV